MFTANTTINYEDDFIVLDDEDFIEVSGGVDPLGDGSRTGGGAAAGSRVPVKSAS